MSLITATQAMEIAKAANKQLQDEHERKKRLLEEAKSARARSIFATAMKDWDYENAILLAARAGVRRIEKLLDRNYGESGHELQFLRAYDFKRTVGYAELKTTLANAGYSVFIEDETSLSYGSGSDSIPEINGVWITLTIMIG